MKILNSDQSRRADKIAMENIGIPGIVLMENAALALVKEIVSELGSIENKKIVIYAGKGNNGGDALAAARHLYMGGAIINVYIMGKKSGLSPDAMTNYNVLCNLGIQMVELDDGALNPSFLKNMIFYINEAELILDGIFGTGLIRPIEGIIRDVVKIINESGKRVISADIPSGIEASTGKVLGIGVKAKTTVTFSYPKLGNVLYPGCEYAGRIVIGNIGIPHGVFDGIGVDRFLIDRDMVKGSFPLRSRIGHKGIYGKTLIITGSRGMTGAGILSGKGALRSGGGLVYLGVQDSLYPIYANGFNEGIIIPMEETDDGYCLSWSNINILKDLLHDKDAVACGPGMGRYDDVGRIATWLILNCDCPLILDADALNGISHDCRILRQAKNPPIITPHLGEMSRLTGLSVEEIKGNTLKTAVDFSVSHNVITVLKGFRTIVALPDGRAYVNPTGNPGMATAGSGDVLTGVITALAGQGLEPAMAAIGGVYVHGLAGDLAAEELGEYGIIASDIGERLPLAIKGLKGKRELNCGY